ncbi:MAG: DUF2949 domain-containing protein [Cyanobacteria bacterium P01_D01_bin.44]
MTATMYSQLLRYLQNELALPEASIALALRQSGQDSSFLPMILWQYGLITLKQLDQIYDWLATTCIPKEPVTTYS